MVACGKTHLNLNCNDEKFSAATEAVAVKGVKALNGETQCCLTLAPVRGVEVTGGMCQPAASWVGEKTCSDDNSHTVRLFGFSFSFFHQVATRIRYLQTHFATLSCFRLFAYVSKRVACHIESVSPPLCTKHA